MLYLFSAIMACVLIFGGLAALVTVFFALLDKDKWGIPIRVIIFFVIMFLWLFFSFFFNFKVEYWNKTIAVIKDNQICTVYDGHYDISTNDSCFEISYFKNGKFYSKYYDEGYNYTLEIK